MSELLSINSPLLPRLRKAAAKDDEALRWLMDSARHWARAEFLRREETLSFREFLPEAIRARMYHLELHVVAVRYGPLSLSGLSEPDKDRTVVGLLREGWDEEYLSIYTGRGEDSQISGMLCVHDVFELPERFRPERWLRPAAPEPPHAPGGGFARAVEQATAAGAEVIYDRARLEYAVMTTPGNSDVFGARSLALAFEVPEGVGSREIIDRFWAAVKQSSEQRMLVLR